MIAHILVWIITFVLGFYGFLWLLRPIIIHHQFKTQQGLIIHLFSCLICLAIMIGYTLLIYYKFNNTIWTCVGSYVVSLIAVISACRKENQQRIANTLLNFNAEGGKDRP